MLNSLVSIVPNREMLAFPEQLVKRLRASMPNSPCSVKEPLLPVYSAEASPVQPKSASRTPSRTPSQFASLQLDVSSCAPNFSPHQLRRMVYRLADANSYQASASLPVTPLPQHVVITLNADACQQSQRPAEEALQKCVMQSWLLSNPITLMFALLFTAFVAAYMCASALLP
ncbi:hypothetical protein BWQ96_02536 [Gracilariopsis chorda]|uniref:Uncharacterized protein n=1 Tax=Gracilariopsis chorda TaxID=448386 RepID=A0A2V3IZV0_9FLOR|nr:hypothetical protein BWQ96_02536 [Gracilariopsis chorda]|eukprot:PXF47674.1 hypothetical protein BWQ96_02536 [Gracilariopsis chorda]